jgi:hypothetical protein
MMKYLNDLNGRLDVGSGRTSSEGPSDCFLIYDVSRFDHVQELVNDLT